MNRSAQSPFDPNNAAASANVVIEGEFQAETKV